MRICYFVSEYPANSHTFIRREIAELERIGISILRVSLRNNDRGLADPRDIDEKTRTHYILDGGIAKFVIAIADAMIRKPRGLIKAGFTALKLMRRSSRPALFHLAYLAEALILTRKVECENVQHIHAHFGTNGAEVAMLCHILTGLPYSFTVHGPDEFDRPEYLGLPTKVRHAAFVCVVSSFAQSQLCRWVPPDLWGKIKVVHCGLDADFLDPQPSRGMPRSQLVTVGRLSEQKGLLVLLHALALLAREGVPFKLTMIGDGPLRPQLEQSICTLQLEQHVELLGWMSSVQVRAAIREARALVLPSFAEGLPVVLMEALALGRPVITTYVAGIPELVTDGVSGWLVPAGSVDRLADAIRLCLNTPDKLMVIMGERGRKRVLEQHDIVWECSKLAALFKAKSIIVDRHEQIEKPRQKDTPVASSYGTTPDNVMATRLGIWPQNR